MIRVNVVRVIMSLCLFCPTQLSACKWTLTYDMDIRVNVVRVNVVANVQYLGFVVKQCPGRCV